MPVIKSAKKRALQNEKRRQINVARKSTLKTAVKKVLAAIANKEDQAEVKALMREAETKLARAKHKVLHVNTADRKIGRLAKRVAEYIKSVQ